jgi:hypothetical protein
MHDRDIRRIANSDKPHHLNWREKDNVEVFKVGGLHVLPFPFLEDNLGYAVFSFSEDNARKLEFLVDPGDFDMTTAVLNDW